VRNVGRAVFAGRVELRCDVHPGEILGSAPVAPPLSPGSRATVGVVVAPPPGVHRPRSVPQSSSVGVWLAERSELSITEAMSRPRPGEPEWVEITSDADVVIALEAFSIDDAAGTRVPLSGVLAPRERLVVSSDAGELARVWDLPPFGVVLEGSPWPALNQSGAPGVVAERVRLLIDDREIDAASLPGGAREGASWERITTRLSGDDLECSPKTLVP
jgi:hypothetical protein